MAEAGTPGGDNEFAQLAELLLGDGADTAPLFAAVAQPKYVWTEKATPTGDGLTVIERKATASVTFPIGKSPWARAVRLHELLHARFSPDLDMPALEKAGELKELSSAACQIAEDIRLVHLAKQQGLLERFSRAEMHYPEKVWARRGNAHMRNPRLEAASLYMATYGQPLEGDWDSRSLDNWRTRAKRPVDRKTLRRLRQWRRSVDHVLTDEPDGTQQFLRIARATQKVLVASTRTGSKHIPGPINPKAPQAPGDGSQGGQPQEQGAQEGGDQPAQAKPGAGQKGDGARTMAKILGEIARSASDLMGQVGTGESTRDPERARALREAFKKELAKHRAAERKDAKADAKPDGDADAKGKGTPSRRRGYGLGPDTPWTPYGDRPPPPDPQVAHDYSLDARENMWGRMILQLAPLERNFRALVLRPGVAAPDGPLPKYFNRWFAGKDIFVRQGLRRGGTLLIDVSGSMGWAWEITKQLIESTPAMTIAVYSGQHDHGHLTIIAKDGRLTPKDWVPSSMGHGSNNTIDGPALAWLARMPRPRVWFSDGEVHGTRQVNGAWYAHHEDAKRLCRLGAIRRTVKPDMVKRIFSGRQVSKDEAEAYE